MLCGVVGTVCTPVLFFCGVNNLDVYETSAPNFFKYIIRVT